MGSAVLPSQLPCLGIDKFFEFSRDYINAEIFKLFDVDGSGKITKEDLDQVAKQMGWSTRQRK